MATHHSYEDVLTCTRRQAHALLTDGDAQQRVWAAWAIAAREPEVASTLLMQAFAREADLGVRRRRVRALVRWCRSPD